MFQYSRRLCKHLATHTKHETFRKLKLDYRNWVRASLQANQNTWVVSNTDKKLRRVNKDISGSLWFHRFNLGVKFRMGSIWKPNKGFSIKLLKHMLQRAEKKRSEWEDANVKHIWTVFVTYSVISYVLSLRGAEGFLLDLKGTRKKQREKNGKIFLDNITGEVERRTCRQATSHSVRNWDKFRFKSGKGNRENIKWEGTTWIVRKASNCRL